MDLYLKLMLCILLRQIQHPNILCFLGTVVTDNSITIISNLVKGLDLHALIFDQENSRVRLYIHIYGLLCV